MANTCDECGFVNGFHNSRCVGKKCYACGSFGGLHYMACPAPANPVNKARQQAKVQQTLQNQQAANPYPSPPPGSSPPLAAQQAAQQLAAQKAAQLNAGYGGGYAFPKKPIAKGIPKNLTLKYDKTPEELRQERLEARLNLFIKSFPVFTALELMCPKCAQQMKITYSLEEDTDLSDPLNQPTPYCIATFWCHGEQTSFKSYEPDQFPYNKWEIIHIIRKLFTALDHI
jgi:hypothetical protein